MFVKWSILVIGLLLCATTVGASPQEALNVLRLYGPGGPHHVMEECAQIYQERHGVKVVVSKAFPHELEQKIRVDGDIYYGGAEYMLEGFNRHNPGVLDMTSVEKLHPRRIGILVRKGNPLSILESADLGQKGVDLLDVKLENMRGFHGTLSDQSHNIRRFEYTGQQGVNAWRSAPEIDAWVTYKTWHKELEEESDFIEIPGDGALRYTPIALTSGTTNRQEAIKFISFLKSPEARKIFEEHGWY